MSTSINTKRGSKLPLSAKKVYKPSKDMTGVLLTLGLIIFALACNQYANPRIADVDWHSISLATGE